MDRLGTPVALIVTTLYAGLALGGVAHAQQDDPFRRDRNQGVRDRPKPEYSAPGVPAGGFRLYPELGVVGYYDDNVFADASNEKQDFVTELRLEAKLNSNWSNHALNARAAVESRFYSDFSEANTTDWTLAGDGRLDIVRGFYVSGGVSVSDLYESWADTPIVSGLENPIEYRTAATDIGVVKRVNRMQFTGRGRYTVFDYQDGRLTGGGTLDQDDRDRTIVDVGGRVDYALNPDAAVFVSLAGNWRTYAEDPPPGGVKRDSSGVEGLFGASFDLTHLVRGEVSIGYMDQSYEDAALSAVSGIATRSKVEWFIDPLVTVTLAASREVHDAGISNAGGYLSDGVSLNLDYEFRRNIVLGMAVGFSRDDYNGVARTDDRRRVEASMEYLINRRTSFAVELGQFEQDSAGADAGREYEISRVSVSLRLRR